MGKGTPTPSLAATNLPPRLTVPPLPPRIHRRLNLSLTPDGVVLRPIGVVAPADEVLVRWGARGRVELFRQQSAPSGLPQASQAPVQATQPTQRDEVELGGVLGIVRLWDTAYLLVFLSPTRPPTRLFPNDDPFGPEPEYTAHEVFTLADVYAVPLTPERAAHEFKRLSGIMAKRAPKAPKPAHARTGSRGLNLWPWANERAPEDTDTGTDSDGDDEDSDSDSSYTRSRRSSIAPEADETPCALPPDPDSSGPEARIKRRLTISWSKFAPKAKTGLSAVAAAVAIKKGGKNASAAARSEASPSTPAPETVTVTANEPEPVPEPAPEPAAEEVPALVLEPPSTTSEDAPHDALFPDDGFPQLPPPAPAKAESAAPPPVDAPQRRELETKIMKQITRELASGEFYYSFDFDLSHTLQHKRARLASRAAASPLLDSLLREASPSQNKPFFPPSPTASILSPTSPIRTDPDIVEPDVHVPLWRRFDRRFFWNEWLQRDFIEKGLHAYVLPIAQGWVQASSFSIPMLPAATDSEPPEPIPVDLVLISRRSCDRAGLRYQRRGIDDEGHVANFVETEMMVRAKAFGKVSLFSFVQIRGSIPLKWSQSPWSMKPPPELNQLVEQTYSVANLHFDELRGRYGPVTIVNLSEQTGKEAVVTNGYGELVKSLDRKDLTYVPFDFHAKCHGMKWENIGELVNALDFTEMGYSWSLQGDLVRKQVGVFRTNCIDCLDRTNVVQSAIARNVLNQMLMQVGIVLDPTTCNVEAVFNDIWANNGDMISLCYAHTSALKGDFVRTGKRDLSGMLNDGVSSLSRMFYGAVSDFFAQAVISFMLGHRNLGVFNEFLENLQSTDASQLIKQSRIRAAAIETSSARVLSDGEVRVAGWTLLSPAQRNVRLSPKLEEKVLLLTKMALYVVSFNYSLEKVNEFTRIPLKSITSIEKGAYILSALQEAGRDPAENAGFVVNFSPADEDRRYSTYSIRNREPSSPSVSTAPMGRLSLSRNNSTSSRSRARAESSASRKSLTLTPKSILSPLRSTPATPTTPTTPIPIIEHSDVTEDVEFFAFKALPREFVARTRNPASETQADASDDEDEDDVVLESHETCRATVDRIARRIAEQCVRASGPGSDSLNSSTVSGANTSERAKALVEEHDVVSLQDAESATSLIARMDYAVKRFLWL